MAREDGTPIYENFTDEQILADIPAHKRAVMRPLLRKPEFCSTCHKVDAPQNRNMNVPIVLMAETEVNITSGRLLPKEGNTSERWNDYGIGLLEQAQYGAASEAFRHASELNPTDSNLLVNQAIAEFKTERFGPERDQIAKAASLIDKALIVNPSNVRAKFYHAIVLRADGKVKEAAEILTRIAAEYPRDREVHRQLGQTLYTLGRLDESQRAFETVLSIDPTDATSYQALASIHASLGRKSEAERAQALYYEWRDDPRAESIAARFFASRPEWAEERISSHSHATQSSGRPTLTGQMAAPIK